MACRQAAFFRRYAARNVRTRDPHGLPPWATLFRCFAACWMNSPSGRDGTARKYKDFRGFQTAHILQWRDTLPGLRRCTRRGHRSAMSLPGPRSAVPRPRASCLAGRPAWPPFDTRSARCCAGGDISARCPYQVRGRMSVGSRRRASYIGGTGLPGLRRCTRRGHLGEMSLPGQRSEAQWFRPLLRGRGHRSAMSLPAGLK
jgi:hypothetical protein